LRLLPYGESRTATPVDYHAHTTHTDGTASVQAMATAAAQAGLAELLFSEHVRHTSDYYPEFAAEVLALSVPGLIAWLGAEAKILDFEGRLDCPAAVADQCEAVIGSVHSAPGAGGVRWPQLEAGAALELEFRAAEAIIRRSQAHILGHPLGMVIRHFKLQPLDHLYRLAVACREMGKAFELNSRYCPDPAAWISIVTEAGCPVSFGSDAHVTEDVGKAWQVFAAKESQP
jgi:histidinol phosphatase-like PHP family hydrolase